jgi:hypothetical protein
MIATIEPDENGDLCLVFPEETINEVGWVPGDTINWIDNADGSWTLRKVEDEKEYVLVEYINTTRVRYVVERPVGDDTPLENLDIHFKEFSQKSLGDVLNDVRVIRSKEDVIALCDADNDYSRNWNDDHKIKTFVITEDDYNDTPI